MFTRRLQLMNDNHVAHLPVVEDEKYVGIISEEDLLQAQMIHAEIKSSKNRLPTVSVQKTNIF